MRSALHAEWTKARTLPSTPWLALAVIASTVGAGAVVCAGTAVPSCPPGECSIDAPLTALSGVYLGQNVVVVFAVLAGTNEYASTMIWTTLVAIPRRLRLLAARLTVVVGVCLAVGIVAVLGSLLVGPRLLPASGFRITDAATLRAGAGTVIYLVLLGLLSLGVGIAVADTAGATSTVLGALYVLPIVASAVPDPDLAQDIHRFAPMTAGLAVRATQNLDQLPVQPWPGLATFAAYTVAVVLVGGLLFVRRDA